MPRYRNAPIEEAMCEFTFATSDESVSQWDLTLPGRMQQHVELKSVYNGKPREQQIQQIMASQLPANAPNIAVSSALLRVLLPTQDGKAVLGIGPNTLSVSSLREYEGWKHFKPRIGIALKAYRETAHTNKILKVTLKYVNRIIAPQPGASTAARFLLDIPPRHEAVIDKTGERIVATLSAYHYRKEFILPDQTKVGVTQATLQAANPDTSEFLLDIETVWDHQAIEDSELAIEKVESLHAIEGAVFESFITDAARSLFDGT